MTRNRTGWASARLLLAGVAVLALPLAGCDSIADDLTDVTPRDQIDPGALGTADGATAQYNGAINRFSVTFSGNNGGTEGIAILGATMADEFIHTGTFSTRESYDRRNENADNGTIGGALRNLHSARVAAQTAHAALAATGSANASDSRLAELKALEGMVYVWAAETFCSGMPFSELVDGVIIEGAPTTTTEALTASLSRFDEAIGGAAGSGNVIRNLALVGKARALMNLGKDRFAEAASLVAAVPTSFQYFAFHSTNGNRNGIFVFNTQNERFSVSHNEGINGLSFRGAASEDPTQADPRVPWNRTGGGTDMGFDPSLAQYDFTGFTTFDDDAVMSNGTEARLIEAEAALNSGDVTGWLGTLNTLRAGVTGLAPLADPGTTTAREDLHFSERAFWLYLTGHRLGDLRRLIRQYSRGAESVFPTGAFHKNGGLYSADVNFPINVTEEANSIYKAAKDAGTINIRGCLSDGA